MKKKTVIAILAVVFAAMVMPQNAVAKEKKVKFLGHEFRGEVDKDKIPCGKGVMNIGGLIIEGVFDSESATEAEVYKSGYVNVPNRKFVGSILYDQTNNITLKSNGTMITTARNEETFEERLKTDLVVNYEDFEPNRVKVTRTYHPFAYNEIAKVFAPPQDVSYDVELVLQDTKASVKKKVWENGRDVEKNVDVETKAYLMSFDEPKDLKDYKDSQGRIWNYNKTTGFFSVQYPNGSYFIKPASADFKDVDRKVVCPDGKIYQYKYWDQIKTKAMSIGNGFLINEEMKGEDFLRYMKSSVISPKFNSAYIYTFEYDLKNLSDEEIGKIIKEKFFPLVNFKGSIEDVTLQVWGIGNYNFGMFENGKYISYASKDAAKAKAEAAEQAAKEKAWKAAVAPYTKRFGFNPMEKSAKQLITYGRSFSLLHDWYYFLRDHEYSYYFFNIHEDQGVSKCYGIYYDKNLTKSGKKVGYIWVAGGKITSVKWL